MGTLLDRVCNLALYRYEDHVAFAFDYQVFRALLLPQCFRAD